MMERENDTLNAIQPINELRRRMPAPRPDRRVPRPTLQADPPWQVTIEIIWPPTLLSPAPMTLCAAERRASVRAVENATAPASSAPATSRAGESKANGGGGGGSTRSAHQGSA